MARGKKEMKPLLLKLGVALALSFAGFLYSRFRIRRVRPSLPPPSSATHSSDDGTNVESRGGRSGQKDDTHASQRASTSSNIGSTTGEKYQERCIQKAAVDNTVVGLSPSSKHSPDKDGFLLPEFNELVKEVDFSATSGISPKKGVEAVRQDAETPKAFGNVEAEDYEQEIKYLSNMVRILRERERNLEVQLLEYYGLKEQEKTVMELENRLRISNMESKLLNLKIESLQADNQRLEAQVADHAKFVSELEAAKIKIKVLKKKLRYEAEQNREHILTLQERVANLRDQEQKSAASDLEIQSKLQRLKDLEAEAEELRTSNLRLQLENAELGQRLESTQILATSVLEDSETAELKEVGEHLKQENEILAKKIERLQADKCGDVEELVYIRWLNACLRFELRNYQPPSGKTVARDLSKKLSPKSEEKAKQLILEYAHSEGLGEKGSSIIDFDSDRWSSSQASYGAEFELSDDFPGDLIPMQKTNRSSKHKFIKKLKKLVRGRDSHHGNQVSSVDKEDSDSSLCSSSNSAGTDAFSNRLTTPSQSSSIPSLDIQRLRNLRVEDIKDLESHQINSDSGSSGRDKRYNLGRRASADLAQEMDNDSVSDLVKYAAALKGSGAGVAPRFRRKSASYSSF